MAKTRGECVEYALVEGILGGALLNSSLGAANAAAEVVLFIFAIMMFVRCLTNTCMAIFGTDDQD